MTKIGRSHVIALHPFANIAEPTRLESSFIIVPAATSRVLLEFFEHQELVLGDNW
jgi:hypothetical protein